MSADEEVEITLAVGEQLEDIHSQLENVPAGEDADFLPDVFFCDYCQRPFDKLGDKFRHIASEHKSEPAPEEASLPREG